MAGEGGGGRGLKGGGSKKIIKRLQEVLSPQVALYTYMYMYMLDTSTYICVQIYMSIYILEGFAERHVVVRKLLYDLRICSGLGQAFI